ncbi:adenylate/guanylate cyclase domain-containing protein [Primorskyibacter sp. S87]|uniref:adenylate/guanylate cyclase domain-containing protein n=1 Tax=Primorskyibacter sp. S87 TaxID=3415126 RepID=UPI003C7EC2F3
MSDVSETAPLRRNFWLTQPDDLHENANQYTVAALERHKREGLELAVKARWIALGLTAVLLVFLNQSAEVLYYHGILALLCLNGWFIRRVGRVGQSRIELVLIFLDLGIMTIGMVAPNPFSTSEMPLAMQYRFENFLYFFIILAAGTMAYSWRTVIAIGSWTAGMWLVGAVSVWYFAVPVPGLSEAASQAFSGFPRVLDLMDPNDVQADLRVQEMVVFMMVAVTLGYSARRFNALLLSNAGLERERANLSRYFSPNVVDQLSQNDEPLKQIRKQDVAVLFIDIVGFTQFADRHSPEEVVDLLRSFHARMEAEVFRHGGTLDKYLGDGLMATFGTPVSGDRDASDALTCARAMLDSMDQWNAERSQEGNPEISIGIGVHFGQAVLGDIGANRLEFAVIGTSVNVAARLEALTRPLGARLIISDRLRDRVLQEEPEADTALEPLKCLHGQEIRGISEPMTVWMLQ